MSPRYVPELDGLRAIAALAVVAFHVRLPGVAGGFLGVDMFFVLSGYLTAAIALSGRFTLHEFMARRLRRLWPLLLFVSVVLAACHAAVGALDPGKIVPGALFLGNLSTAYFGTGGLMIHAWTLGTEMQFYGLVAIFAIFLERPAFRAICGALFLAATVARIGAAHEGQLRLAFYSPLTHSSGLFLGAVLSTLPLDRMRAPGAVLAISAVMCTIAFACAPFATAETLVIWIAVAEFASAGLIAAVVRGCGSGAAPLRFAPLRHIGVLSFGLYLWHYPIAVFARAVLDPVPAFLLATGTALVFAALSFHFVERPFRATALQGSRTSSPFHDR